MPEVTYKRLDETLRALGFSVRDQDGQTRVYRHASTGAVVILPLCEETEVVLPRHLAGVQLTLDGFGIADPLALIGKLQKAI